MITQTPQNLRSLRIMKTQTPKNLNPSVSQNLTPRNPLTLRFLAVY